MIMLHVVFIICIRAMMYWKYVLLYFFRLGVHLLIGVKAIDGRENLPTVLWSTMVSVFIYLYCMYSMIFRKINLL